VIVAVNAGSSSIKCAVFDAALLARRFSGVIERIGTPGARLVVTPSGGGAAEVRPVNAGTFDAAAAVLVGDLRERLGDGLIEGIGHRVVHGGVRLLDHQLITDEVVAELRRAVPFDRAHLPREIALIEALRAAFPSVPQAACFDTVFHRDLPRVARLLPIPRRYFDQGIRRYGFHGLSYTYLMQRLAELAPGAADGRVILAHLGSGASMAAVRGGKIVDTTMGFTPAGGLVMGTRPGDLDPGLLAYLVRSGEVPVERLEAFVSDECGLLGVSETGSDIRDLLERGASDRRAAEAVELFCYRVRKETGALAAAMGGLDTLVFSGGIGEHSAEVRAAACAGLECLGVTIDAARNSAGEGVISAAGASVGVRVIETDEELVIARLVRGLALQG
jgi:acetate kinase